MAEDGKCRKSGLELLRIIAVILIVAHHEVAHSDINVFDQTFCVKRLFFQLLYLAPGKLALLYSCLFLSGFLLISRRQLKELLERYGYYGVNCCSGILLRWWLGLF